MKNKDISSTATHLPEKNKNNNVLTAIAFDIGYVESPIIGSADLAGYVRCVSPLGLYPEIDKKNFSTTENLCIQWAVDMGLINKQEKYYEKFCRSKFASLAAHTVPNMPLKDAEMYLLLAMFLFVFDDVLDNLLDLRSTKESIDRKTLDSVVTTFIEILNGHIAQENEIPPIQFPLYSAFCKTLLRFKALANAKHLKIEFFNKRIEDYLKAVIWEFVENEYGKNSISEETYSFKRRHTIGFPYLFELVFAMQNIQIGTEIREKLLMQRYMEAVCNVLFLTNDIFSLRKELLAGETENLVLIRCKNNALDLQQSFDTTLELLNSEISEVIRLGKVLKKFFNGEDITRFITIIENYLDGHLYWYFDSKRYGDIKFEMIKMPGKLAVNDQTLKKSA